jgi:hypothetical protein
VWMFREHTVQATLIALVEVLFPYLDFQLERRQGARWTLLLLQ